MRGPRWSANLCSNLAMFSLQTYAHVAWSLKARNLHDAGRPMQLPNAENWKSRAAQVRRLAESMDPDPARDVLLAIAQQYEEAAKRYSAEGRPPPGGGVLTTNSF